MTNVFLYPHICQYPLRNIFSALYNRNILALFSYFISLDAHTLIL